MMKIKVTDILNKLNGVNNEEFRHKYVADMVEITPYVPFAKKVLMCKNIVEFTGREKTSKQVSYKIDSPTRYLFYIKCLIDNYTNIETNDRFIDDYDLLVSNHILKDIINLIPQEEISEFKTIFNMVQDDFSDNYGTTRAYIHSIVNMFKSLPSIDDNTLNQFMASLMEDEGIVSEEDVEETAEETADE